MLEGRTHIRRIRYQRRMEFHFEESSFKTSTPEAIEPEDTRRQVARRLEGHQDLHAYASPHLAKDICKGILTGKWMVTDLFEMGARRFVIAERCREGDARALTDREQQVLNLTVRGHSNKYVALELGLTPSTVSTHLRRLMEKIGVGSREALIQAIPIHHAFD